MSSKTQGSWGRFPAFAQTLHACHWREELAGQLQSIAASHGSTLAFGNGRSYGDSCMASSDHVVHMRTLDRFIAIDWKTGLVTAEAGVTLAEVLALAIPQGWFLPVTPGTRFVTLGGALANDVHGKNHHVRGTFGRHVKRFGLTRSDRAPCVCSATENSELFAATIGGLGLTGIIAWMEIQLMPVQSSAIATQTIRFDGLQEFFALSGELDTQHEYSVSWIDCVASGKALGRGIFTVGDHARDGDLKLKRSSELRVPFTPPVSMINTLSLRAFNTAYYRAHKTGRHHSQSYYEPFFYPLDRILHWNRLYGPQGFQQYQCVVPEDSAADAIAELLATIAVAGTGSFLAVLKRCGDIASPGLLSFPLAGSSLALDFPQNPALDRMLRQLDDITRAAGGRLYPAKDAHMSGDDFRECYPAWQQVESLRDPAINSRFWKRVSST